MSKKNKGKGFTLPDFKTLQSYSNQDYDTGIQTYIQSNETEQITQKLFWCTRPNGLQQGC